MREILYRYKKYEIEYLWGLGIVVVNKEMPVVEFIKLKNLLKMSGEPITDIRLYGNRLARIKGVD